MSILKHNTVRRYDLDWLRILATLLLPYPTARIFDGCPRFACYYIKNEINSPQIELFTRFIDMRFMPLFFLL